MLENLSETSEVTDKFFNSDVEDSVEQPETDETTDEEIIEESDAEEIEESEDDEEQQESITVNGEEITPAQIEEMQKQQLMHADYTKKTQAISEERKQIVALNSDLTSSIEILESLIVEEENADDLNELLEDNDTAEYIRRTKQIEAKKAKLVEAKKRQADALKSTQAAENQKLVTVMTEWSDPKSGATTQKADIDAALSYASEIGLDSDSLDKLSDHRIIRALIDAGKFRKLKDSKPEVKKRKTTASKKTSKKTAQGKKTKSLTELFYGAK